MSKPREILQAIKAALSSITTTAPYKTGIGQKIQTNAVIRQGDDLPSIAIRADAGVLTAPGVDPTTQKPYVSAFRSMDFSIEAAAKASLKNAHDVVLDMLDDIEIALSRAGSCEKPDGTRAIRLTTWQIADRPDGIDAVVLTVSGTAEYLQPRNT